MLPSLCRDSTRPPFAARRAVLWGCLALLAGRAMALGPPPAAEPVAPVNAPPAVPAEAPSRSGCLIRVASPISETVERRVRAQVARFLQQARREQKQPLLVLELQSGRSDFGKALDLARFLSGPDLEGARTLAYLPQSLEGHALLVAMACDEIVLGPDASFGPAAPDEARIGPEMRSVYTEIAGRRNTVPVDLALGLLDPALEVLQVETEVGREFVLRERLEQVRAQRAVQQESVAKRAGEPAHFSPAEARQLGFVSALVADRAALAQRLGLPRDSMQEDPSLERDWQAMRIDLIGEIDASQVRQIQRLIENQLRHPDTNLICLWVDSPGGSATDALQLAHFLADLDPQRVRTVAYVPRRAAGEAAFLCLACDQLVLETDAHLGGAGPYQLSVEERRDIGASLSEVAERKLHAPALARALVETDLSVRQFTRAADGAVSFFTTDEAAALDPVAGWVAGAEITQPGRVLDLTAAEAEQLGVARWVVAGFDEFKTQFGLQLDPPRLAPNWADRLAQALNGWALSTFILVLGVAALYVEASTPGFGIPGLTAAMCFLLYFWAHWLGGTADWLEVILFVAGVAFLLIELFILPGFGICGFAGGTLILFSLVMASQTFVMPRNDYQMHALARSLGSLAVAVVGSLACIALLRRFVISTRLASPMILAPPTNQERDEIAARESLAHYQHLVGQRGQVVTPLRPAGKIRVQEQTIDVVADGEIIDIGRTVEIVSVHGNRVLVKATRA